MASRQSVSSILKPPKVRPPLKEIDPVDEDIDENTATISKRKVSFSGMNKIKMYNTGATSLTVHQTPMFDEQLFSDSSNAEKTNLSGKFDGQITFESTNCTNVEGNDRVIIEYESPSDNMEMTEAITGKISSDTIYDIDNTVSEHINYSSDYSANNMEFTEAIKGGKILNTDIESNMSVIEMSETLNNTCNEQPKTQFDLHSSVSLPNRVEKKMSDIGSYSSNMNFTCENIKRNSMDLTSMTGISSKSIWLSDDNKSYSMELSQLPDKQNLDENYELVYDCSVKSETSCEINENSNCDPQIVYDCNMEPDVSTGFNENNRCDSHVSQNAILYTKNSEINNYSNIKNSNSDNEIVELLSMSMVSMDIDPTSESNEYDMNCVGVNNLELYVNKQKTSLVPVTIGIENVGPPVKSSQYEIDNYTNNTSRISMASTGSSFIQEVSPEKNINESITVQEPEQNISCAHAYVVDNNVFISDTSIVSEENKIKNYSRKTMIHTGSLIDQEKSSTTEDILSMSVINEENQQKICSRKSVAPTSDLNKTHSTENKSTMSDMSIVVEENQQEVYSRKSIAPTSDINQIKIFENEDMSNTSMYRPNEDLPDNSPRVEENQQKVYSRKSVAPTFELNQTSSYENEGIMSDNSGVVEEIKQNVYSRKSIAPTSDINQTKSDTSVVVKDNQQEVYSRKSIAPTSNKNQTQFFENEDMSNTSLYRPTQSYVNEDLPEKSPRVEENQQNIYSRKSVAPTFDLNQTSSYENEGIMSDNSGVVEDIKQNVYSRKSIAPTSDINQTMSDTSVVVEENQQEVYSRKSIAPTYNKNQTQFFENEDMSNTSLYRPTQSYVNEDLPEKSPRVEENQQNICSRKSVAPKFDLNQTSSHENEGIMSDNSGIVEDIKQNVYSRKSIAPTSDINQTMSDTSVVVEENQQEVYSRKSIAPTYNKNQTQFFENEDMSNTSLYRPTQSYVNEDLPEKSPRVEENQQNICSRKSVAPKFDLNQTSSHDNEVIMTDTSVILEQNQQKIYLKKSITPELELNLTHPFENKVLMSDLSAYSPTKSIKKEDTSDSFIMAEENQLKRYSRKSVGPTSLSPQNESPKYMSDDNNSLLVKENNKVPVFINNLSLTTNDSNIQQINLPDQNKGQIFLENEHQSALMNNTTYSDDNFNSPFMKKSRKSVGPKYLTKKLVHTKSLDVECKSETIDENSFIDNLGHENKMDISIENESKNENNSLLQEKSMILSSPLNKISIIKNVFHSSASKNQNLSSLMNDSVKQDSNEIDESFNKDNSNNFCDISNDVKEHDTNHVIGGEYEIGKETIVMTTNELKHKDETNLIQPVKNNKIFKECGRTNEEIDNQLIQPTDDICNTDFVLTSTSYTSRHSIDKITNNVCLKDISNMSTSNESYQHVEKSLIGNRKRSYSSRVGAPLLCSSFISKPNINNCTNEEFPREDFLNGSSINKTDTTNDNSVNKDSLIDNAIVVDPIKDKSVEENISNTVVEFLSRWNEQLIEKNVVLEKCTNSEWIFNILDNNIILIVSYSPIVNNDSFLKVADISFTTKMISENEILKFGINWILSKYNPKVYKQICFTSRDIELLLKSLLEDVQFINMVMKNMFFICNVYCVTFKDNKAQFILHNINPCPLMARIEISLSNIHKISVKDITVDCIFGFFNTKELDGIMESVTKDCNVLQSIIEKIRKICLHR